MNNAIIFYASDINKPIFINNKLLSSKIMFAKGADRTATCMLLWETLIIFCDDSNMKWILKRTKSGLLDVFVFKRGSLKVILSTLL